MLVALVRLLFVNLLGNLWRMLRNLARLPRRRPSWVRVSLKEALPSRPSRIGPFRAGGPSLAGVARLLDELAGDARVEGVVVELHHVSGGWAQARSLRDLLARLAGKKRLVAHLSSPSLRDYYVACGAPAIAADESGPLALHGLAAEARFFRRALEHAGARAETEYRGAYKSMGEMLTRDDMSPAQREATEAILDGLLAEVVAAVAAARKLEPERARALVEGGPYQAADAQRLGLVDSVCYADQAAASIARAPAPPRPATVRAWRRAQFLPPVWRPLFARRRSVAVVAMHGAIVGGEGSGRRSLGSEAAARVLTAVRESPSTVAVVLHLDSRGGSASASDLIWREVKLLAAKKPVVAYMHDVCASGGYYIACAANRILAQPTTLTGSIGVVAGKVSLGALLDRIGITTVSLARGEAATMMSPSRPFSDEQRRRLAAEVDALYQQFVRKVAEGRKLDGAEAELQARGRVWLGAEAQRRRLVDELGSVEDAVQLAERLAGLEGLPTVEVSVTPRRRSILARLAAAAPAPLDELEELVAIAGERALFYAPSLAID